MTTIVDFLELALGSTREAFVAGCPYLFLLGEESPSSAQRARQRVDDFDGPTVGGVSSVPRASAAPRRLVLPVRKTNDTFPSMISVGRTANNDIVLRDSHISRLHAYFHLVADGLELADADSTHGTYVGGRRLAARAAERVLPDQTIRFADWTLTLLTAEGCWDQLHRVRSPRPPDGSPGK
jgi:hypothetical protein